jgi:hypothetical protein
MIHIRHSAGGTAIADPHRIVEARPGLSFPAYGESRIIATGNNGYVRGSIHGMEFRLEPDSLMHIDRVGRFTQTRTRWRVDFVRLGKLLNELWPKLEKGTEIQTACMASPNVYSV